MRRGILLLALGACLLLGGCARLLERSYGAVEPYADRYWDPGAEDTLRVDNYQDLVNSLLMLIEQGAEEAVVRCYGESGSYQEVSRARQEVRRETMQGAYLLRDLRFTLEEGSGYGEALFTMTYREDAEDLAGIMILSDTQSLVDLLRLALREEHGKITARFTYDTPREAVTAAVEGYWQELYREELAAEEEVTVVTDILTPEDLPADGEPSDLPAEAESPDAPEDEEPASEENPASGEEPAPEEEPAPVEEPAPEEGTPEAPAEGGEPPEDGAAPASGEPEPDPIEYPPCPWTIRFYPSREPAELVEILLAG